MSENDDTLPADDTLVLGDTPVPSSTGPRIRPSRSAPSNDYPDLQVVDPSHYLMSREIARGGMGVIHVARDRRLGREVAIKEVISGGATIARRFEREARITAQLQHPSIINVHEAGMWPSGERFYAMRLVQGRSLEEVIDETKTFDERLALLPNVLAIADAMAYAHDQGVIHRDLKPRNVVLGAFGETVVIDWGLAKHLSHVDSIDPDLPRSSGSSDGSSNEGDTTVGDVIGTPAYMPPEQAAGAPVDERADVYAIGAILYHVLANQPPFVAGSSTELLAAVHKAPPPRVSELAPAAPQELVTIVERAMHRNMMERYPSARELAEDLRRFQTGQLVGAHRYSTRQLIRRWLARHRTAVIAVVAASVVAIAIGVFALSRVFAAQGVAEEQRALAIANQNNAEGLMKFMLEDLRPKLEHVGKLDLLDAVARRATAYYDTRGEAGSEEDALLSAAARIDIAHVVVSRGDLPAALAQLEKSKTQLDRLVATRPLLRYQVRALDVRYHIGDVLVAQGNLAGALASYREALTRAEPLAAANADDDNIQRTVRSGHSRIGAVLVARGDLDNALVSYRAALAIDVSRAARKHAPGVINDLVVSHGSVGRVLWENNRLDESLRSHRAALAIAEREAASDPKDMLWPAAIASSHISIGKILHLQKDLPGALVEFRAALPLYERLATFDPSNPVRQIGRVTAVQQIGVVLFDQKDLPGALGQFQEVLKTWVQLTAQDPSNTDWQRNLSVALNKVGDVELATKDTAGALTNYRAALAVRERLVAKDPSNEKWRRDLYYSHIKLVGLHKALGNKPEVISELRLAVAISEGSVSRNPTNAASQDDLMKTYVLLGQALLDVGDRAGGRAQYQAAVDVARKAAARANALPMWQVAIEEITKLIAELDKPAK